MWQMAAIGALGGLMNAMGQNKAAKRQNRAMQQFYNPANVNARAAGMNPWAYAAMNSPGFRNAYMNIANNPGYIDPKLKAYAFMQNDRASQGAMQRLQAAMGRSGNTGGMANATAMGAMGMGNLGRARIANNFANMQAQLMRGDLGMLQGNWQQAQQQALGMAGNQAQAWQGGTPWQTTAGNAITSGLAAYGSMGRPQGQTQTPQTYQGNGTGMWAQAGPPPNFNMPSSGYGVQAQPQPYAWEG